MAQIQKPCMEVKLVITLTQEDNRQWRHSLDLPKHARSHGKGIDVIAMTKQVDSDKTFSYFLEVTLMIMPKVTYPRPCPTCGKHFNSSHFFQHKRRCGTTEHRVLCLFCPLTFAYKQDMEWHVRQQHSNNPLRFPCTICGTELTSAKSLWLHVETVQYIQFKNIALAAGTATRRLQGKRRDNDTCDVFMDVSVESKKSIYSIICSI